MRNIDADKLCEALKCMASVQCPDKQNTILGVVSSIENFPTADVVPKSEVEQLKQNLEQCENGYRQHIHLLQCKFADEKREIFAEIEKFTYRYLNDADYSVGDMIYDIAELKKKNTEGEQWIKK